LVRGGRGCLRREVGRTVQRRVRIGGFTGDVLAAVVHPLVEFSGVREDRLAVGSGHAMNREPARRFPPLHGALAHAQMVGDLLPTTQLSYVIRGRHLP
jgi:hypothetical protein